ncbi:hypothetical protein [Vreelandella stevensii]|uniref:hypothetical protein n=1 Tax=Vreelandella stevensii TaxID=502821 RepID=UPI0037485573
MSLTPSDGLSRHLDALPRYRRYRHRVIVIYSVSLCAMLVLFGLEELPDMFSAALRYMLGIFTPP